jgi:hypothetical protein
MGFSTSTATPPEKRQSDFAMELRGNRERHRVHAAEHVAVVRVSARARRHGISSARARFVSTTADSSTPGMAEESWR